MSQSPDILGLVSRRPKTLSPRLRGNTVVTCHCPPGHWFLSGSYSHQNTTLHTGPSSGRNTGTQEHRKTGTHPSWTLSPSWRRWGSSAGRGSFCLVTPGWTRSRRCWQLWWTKQGNLTRSDIDGVGVVHVDVYVGLCWCFPCRRWAMPTWCFTLSTLRALLRMIMSTPPR